MQHDDIIQHGLGALHPRHVCTYSCLKASTCSMVVIPARAKLSLYWFILMDSSHSGTDRNMVPSQPLVLGRRMETLRNKSTFVLASIYCDIIASVCQFHLLNTHQGFKTSLKRNSVELTHLSCRSRKREEDNHCHSSLAL